LFCVGFLREQPAHSTVENGEGEVPLYSRCIRSRHETYHASHTMRDTNISPASRCPLGGAPSQEMRWGCPETSLSITFGALGQMANNEPEVALGSIRWQSVEQVHAKPRESYYEVMVPSPMGLRHQPADRSIDRRLSWKPFQLGVAAMGRSPPYADEPVKQGRSRADQRETVSRMAGKLLGQFRCWVLVQNTGAVPHR
jgi:hypothetical protein